MTLLYVDDDIDDRAIFSEALEHIEPSCFFIGAPTGEAALKILLITVPDYIFLDINMPQLNGRDVLLKIRSSKDLKDVPVIMFSTSINERDRKEFLAAGANKCVAKPSSFDQLCGVIQSILFPNDLLYKHQQS
jgi:CheY-like chemotaxis protein